VQKASASGDFVGSRVKALIEHLHNPLSKAVTWTQLRLPLSRNNKELSYCREIALQGGLVMAKSGRLELEDIILRTL